MSDLRLIGIAIGDLWGPQSEDVRLGMYFSDGSEIEHIPMSRIKAVALQEAFAYSLRLERLIDEMADVNA